jgi:hypothetical protein
MRVRGLKWVPVVDDPSILHLQGYVRRDGMLGFVLEKLGKMGI